MNGEDLSRPLFKRPLTWVAIVLVMAAALGGFLFWHQREQERKAREPFGFLKNSGAQAHNETPEGATKFADQYANKDISDKSKDQQVMYYLTVGQNYFYGQQYQKALEQYLNADKLSPGSPAVLEAIGMCYFNLNDTANAKKYLTDANDAYQASTTATKQAKKDAAKRIQDILDKL